MFMMIMTLMMVMKMIADNYEENEHLRVKHKLYLIEIINTIVMMLKICM